MLTLPWGEWKHGRPLSAISMSRLLKNFEPPIRPKTIRFSAEVRAKGYDLEDFSDAFVRYLPIPPESSGDTGDNPHNSAINTGFLSGDARIGVTGEETAGNTQKSAIVTDVTDRTPPLRDVGDSVRKGLEVVR